VTLEAYALRGDTVERGGLDGWMIRGTVGVTVYGRA
jgi:hypothetical protein